MMELLNAHSLCKKYGQQLILNEVDFTLCEQEIAVIKGRSGTGKSTFLNICSMLEKPDNGEILYRGKSVNNCSYDEKQRILREEIGYVFQDFNLFENLTVYENLYIYMMLVSDLGKYEINQVINKNLEELGLLAKIHDKVRVLSGGEKQRVAMVRTMLVDKKIVFADEPTANIDDENAKIMVDIFNKLKERKTGIIIVSHDDIFDCIADRIYHLEGGGLIWGK